MVTHDRNACVAIGMTMLTDVLISNNRRRAGDG